MTTSHLQIEDPNPPSNTGPEYGIPLITGNGRAHSVTLEAGLLLTVRWFRVSLAYVYERIYYTGASGDDVHLTPNADLDGVWRASLDQDRHSVRLEAGYAF